MVAGPRPGGVVVGDIPMDERILRMESLDLPWCWVGHLES